MRKVVLFALQGEALCFIHVLLNALDMQEKGYEVRIVVEGAACSVLPAIAQPHHFLHGLYTRAKIAGLFAGACLACSTKQNVDAAIASDGIPLIGDMHGHPSLSTYVEAGFQIITL